MTALKTLVLTSTPSSPNRQLHPQLQSSGTRGAYKHVGGHIRNKSASGAFPSSIGKPEPSSVSIQPAAKEDREVTWMVFAHVPLFSFKYVPATWTLFLPLIPVSSHSYLCFSFLTTLTSPCLDLPLCLWYLFLSQPAVPALLSLILCLVPGQSVSVNFDHYWQERGEGLDIDGRQVTASPWPALSCWQMDLFSVVLALYGTMSRFFLPPEHKVIIIHCLSWEKVLSVVYCS